MKIGICLPLYGALLLSQSVAALHAQAIRSPWDGHPVAATEVAETCPQLQPVPADLTTDGFYKIGDATHSIIDPKRMEAYTQSSGPPKAAATAIVREADRYRTTGSHGAAVCTISMLEQMARANAMGGHMSSGQAYYVQGWLAGSMAFAYLKVREGGVATPEQTKVIAAWLGHLGKSTRDWYERGAGS